MSGWMLGFAVLFVGVVGALADALIGAHQTINDLRGQLAATQEQNRDLRHRLFARAFVTRRDVPVLVPVPAPEPPLEPLEALDDTEEEVIDPRANEPEPAVDPTEEHEVVA